jgi:hypothetical protein
VGQLLFLVGKKEISEGQCLVAGEYICRLWDQGGLRVKDLKLQSLALRTRWEWLRRTDMGRPY